MTSKPSRIAAISALALVLLLCLPFLFATKKIVTEYDQLKDVRFQSERLMQQNQKAIQLLETVQNSNQNIQSEFNPLTGSQSEAYAALQTQTRALISKLGGTIDTVSSVRGQQEHESKLQPISVNIRWNGNEAALGLFLERLSEPQNLKLNTLNIQRRQGTSSLVDVRMQVSALWENTEFTQEVTP